MKMTAIKTALGLAVGGALLASPAQALDTQASQHGMITPVTAQHHDDRFRQGRGAYRYDNGHQGRYERWEDPYRDHRYDEYPQYRREVDQRRYNDPRYRDRHYDYRDQRVYRDPRVYRDQRVHQRHDRRKVCRQTDGGTGAIIGGAIGALLGREIDKHGDRTLGTVLGAAGGALIGSEIEKGRCR